MGEDIKAFDIDTDHSTVPSILRTIDQMVASLVRAAWTPRNEGMGRGTGDLLSYAMANSGFLEILGGRR